MHVVDADEEARAVTAPGGAVHDAVVRRWPQAARADGTLDRAALGRIVFADPAALRELEALVHPAVRPRVLARIAAAEAVDAPAIAIEAIKLVEGGLAADCHEVWLVTCDPARTATAADQPRNGSHGRRPADRRPGRAGRRGWRRTRRSSSTRAARRPRPGRSSTRRSTRRSPRLGGHERRPTGRTRSGGGRRVGSATRDGGGRRKRRPPGLSRRRSSALTGRHRTTGRHDRRLGIAGRTA